MDQIGPRRTSADQVLATRWQRRAAPWPRAGTHPRRRRPCDARIHSALRARLLASAGWVDPRGRGLRLADILDGIRSFAAGYRGALASETLLVAGVNDGEGAVAGVAEFLAGAGIRLAYLAIPHRRRRRR